MSNEHIHHYTPRRAGTWNGEPSYVQRCDCGKLQGDQEAEQGTLPSTDPLKRLPTTGPCEGCGAPIHWAKTIGGRGKEKRMPCDVVEDRERGNMAVRNGVAQVLKRGQITGAHFAGEPLYTSHFATCPNAAEFRRKAGNA